MRVYNYVHTNEYMKRNTQVFKAELPINCGNQYIFKNFTYHTMIQITPYVLQHLPYLALIICI